MTDFRLVVGDAELTTFTRGFVTREFDRLADTFEFNFADLRTDLSNEAQVRVGAECYIELNGYRLLTGYIDDTSTKYSGDDLRLRCRGRSKTGDLVDSSAVRDTGRWRNATLQRIVSDLCGPFGIEVELDERLNDAVQPFRRFAIEPGEAVADAINRACRLRGVYATTTVFGNVLLTRSGFGTDATVRLEYGKNIVSGERSESWTMRHNLYLTKGQVPSDESLSGRGAAQPGEFIFDEGVDRYRPLLLISTGQDRKGDLRTRAQWERNRRAGTGERWLYRVDGYGFAGSLWEPNALVGVSDPRTATEEPALFVSAVTYRWDAEGTDAGRATDLTLTRPEAYTIEAYPPRKRVYRQEAEQTWTQDAPWSILDYTKARREIVSGFFQDPDGKWYWVDRNGKRWKVS